jgi:hypothetical protein
MSQTATTPSKSAGILHPPRQRGLVQQARQPVQIGALLAFAAQVVQLGAQFLDAIDLAFAPHRHGGERQHAMQSEIVVCLMVQVTRPRRRAAGVV